MSTSNGSPAFAHGQDLERLTSMIDSVSDAIITVDSRGVIEFANRGAQELFGYCREALVGRNVSTLMRQPECDHHDSYIRAYLKTGQSRVMNHRRSVVGLRIDGTPVPLDITLGQMVQDGEQKFTAIMRDVTEQRRLLQVAAEAERKLQEEKNRADEANRAKSTFLATMSHEIRTPMNGVIGSLELLSLTSLTEEQRETVQMAEQSGRELLRILDDILDFSKIEAGRLELHYEKTEIREHVIDKVVATYAHLASKKGLRLESRVDPKVAQWVCTDPLRLRQILHNFVSNAVKFTQAGQIEVALDMIDFGPYSQFLRFSVKDTGIGISPENQARLFKPFVQADGDTTRRFGGSGLGLVICQRLAYNMGAKVSMDSTPGAGTTMSLTVELPVTGPGLSVRNLEPNLRAPATAVPLPSILEASEQRTLILVVDDHATNRNVLLRQLASLGYAAESAANGIEALDMLASGRHSLVISDCQMPEMDGYTLARTIRTLEQRAGAHDGATKPIPIIACTANVFASDEARAREAGMDDFLSKPTAISALKSLLEKYLPLHLPPSNTPTAIEASSTAENDSLLPLDETHLTAMTGGDFAARAEFLADFVETCRSDVESLKAAYYTRDLEMLKQTAHRICGASKTIGARGLAAASLAIERACRVQQADTKAGDAMDAWSDDTKAAWDQFFDELEAFGKHLSQ